jgi:prolyl-tRNA synthetase
MRTWRLGCGTGAARLQSVSPPWRAPPLAPRSRVRQPCCASVASGTLDRGMAKATAKPSGKPHGVADTPAPAKAAKGARITPRAADYSQWYADVIAGADLTDASPVKGCVILKPAGFAIWERIQAELDARIRSAGAVNAYFPLLLPISFLSREAQHVEGFAKECAVVTHHRLRTVPAAAAAGADADRRPTPVQLEPDPDAKLPEPLVIRPTSEAIIWSALARWIHSYRDLPVLLNQWANVVRWEMRTRPFLRTSEFLWQEGHTAHATEAEARAFAARMLDVYADVCERVLAIPVTRGVKTPSERFAGADDTLCLEAMMQNGWALQAATSHFLGQNFARAFDVQFETAAGKRCVSHGVAMWAAPGSNGQIYAGTPPPPPPPPPP